MTSYLTGWKKNNQSFSVKDTEAREYIENLQENVSELQDAIEQIQPGLSDNAKLALLDCFAHVAWIDEHGHDYYDALESALNPKTLTSITATFNQGQNVIYTNDPLDFLKQYLTVVATYSDSTSSILAANAYILIGTLTEGTSAITVSYRSKTDTFNVTITAMPPSLTATFTPGTHKVYPTDSLESLRNYLTVKIVEEGEPDDIVTEYTLTGDISSLGTRTITVTYENYSATFTVTVEANATGILYDWDFTESLTDKRQVTTALLATGEAWEIPGKSEGTTVPTRTSSGVVFDNAQQLVRLLSKDVDTTSFLLDKTIQVDFASYNPQVTVNSSYPEVRILSVGWDNSQSVRAFELGLRYQYWVNGNNSHGTPSDGSTTTFEGLTFATVPWNSGIYFDKIQASPAFTQSSISGHTLSVYIDSQGLWHVYIDTTLVGTSTNTVTNTAPIYGLQIGAGGRPAYGGILYNAIVTGARIYDGNIMAV